MLERRFVPAIALTLSNVMNECDSKTSEGPRKQSTASGEMFETNLSAEQANLFDLRKEKQRKRERDLLAFVLQYEFE